MELSQEFKTNYGSIRGFSDQDIGWLFLDMIAEDREDARRAGYGDNYVKMVVDTVFTSEIALSIVNSEGALVTCFGVSAAAEEGVGVMWGFSTNKYHKHDNLSAVFKIGEHTKCVLDFFHDIFPVIQASVLVENRSARRRMRFAGFRMSGISDGRALYIRHR